VTNGLFNVALDFGPAAFDGSARWLDIGVRTNGSGADYAALTPRQPITPTPYAIHAANAKLFDGQGTNLFAPTTGSTSYVAKSGDTMTGTLNLPADGLRVGNDQLHVSGGSVGVGPTEPGSKLDIFSSSIGPILRIGSVAVGNSNDVSLDFYAANETVPTYARVGSGVDNGRLGNEQGNLTFST
jgi:hypothetical protein